MESQQGILERDPVHYQKVTAYDLKRANIPKRLWDINPDRILECDREKINNYLNVMSGNTDGKPEHGIMFYHDVEESTLPEIYMSYLLIGAMFRRRTVYCISTFDLIAYEYDHEFIKMLMDKEFLGIYNFPEVHPKIEFNLARIICGRYDRMAPTLFASSVPDLQATLNKSFYPKFNTPVINALFYSRITKIGTGSK